MAVKDKILDWAGKNKYVILVLLVGLTFLLIPQGSSKEEPKETQPVSVQQTDITQELTQILSQIDGAGRVKVMLTVRTGQTTVYQFDESLTGGETGSENRDTVIITDGDRVQSGLIQRIDPPQYWGAIVLCSGADSPTVRLGIIEAVSKVTGLGTDRISVLKLK